MPQCVVESLSLPSLSVTSRRQAGLMVNMLQLPLSLKYNSFGKNTEFSASDCEQLDYICANDGMTKTNWYTDWFDSPFYHRLYFEQNEKEAEAFYSGNNQTFISGARKPATGYCLS